MTSRRGGALIVDGLIVMAFGYLLGLMYSDSLARLGPGGGALGLTIAVLYFGLMNSSIGRGQSLGKRLFRIKVVDAQGAFISPLRSLVRYLILDSSLLLGSLAAPVPALGFQPQVALGLAFVWGAAAALYLHLFERRSRRLLHDLLTGTCVVDSSNSGPVALPPIWKGHWVVLGALFVALAALLTVAAHAVSKSDLLREFGSAREALLESGKLHTAILFDRRVRTPGGTSSAAVVVVTCRDKPADHEYEKIAGEVASIVLRRAPRVMQRDVLNVVVRYGYDISIASYWTAVAFPSPPSEWKRFLLAPEPQETPPPESGG